MNPLGKIFRSKKPTSGSRSTKFPDASIESKLLPLEIAVFTAAMEASKAIEQGRVEMTGQVEMPLSSDWPIRVEEVGFFLHLVYRLAFKAGGSKASAHLQDYLTVRVVNNLVDSSWSSSNAKPGVDKAQFLGSMKLEVLDMINEAEMEYAQCGTVFTTPYGSYAPEDTDVTGCLAKRIASYDTGHADTDFFRALIWESNVRAYGIMQFDRQVELAIGAIDK